MRFSYFIIIDTNFLTVCTLTVRLYKSISTKLSYQVVACVSLLSFLGHYYYYYFVIHTPTLIITIIFLVIYT